MYAKNVDSVARTSSQNPLRLKPSRNATDPPAMSDDPTMAHRAVTWKSGNIEYARSSGPRSRMSIHAAEFHNAERLPCMTPFDGPVVPEVYMM